MQPYQQFESQKGQIQDGFVLGFVLKMRVSKRNWVMWVLSIVSTIILLPVIIQRLFHPYWISLHQIIVVIKWLVLQWLPKEGLQTKTPQINWLCLNFTTPSLHVNLSKGSSPPLCSVVIVHTREKLAYQASNSRHCWLPCFKENQAIM